MTTPYALHIDRWTLVPVHRLVTAGFNCGLNYHGAPPEKVLEAHGGREMHPIILRFSGDDRDTIAEWPYCRAWWDLVLGPARPPAEFPWPGQVTCSMGMSGWADRCTTHPGGACAPPRPQAPGVHPPAPPSREPPPTE